MKNFYATKYTKRKRYYMLYFLFVNYYLALMLTFLLGSLFPNLFGRNTKTLYDFIFNQDLLVIVTILILVTQIILFLTTNIYTKNISLTADTILIKLFNKKEYKINFTELLSFEVEFSKFWGWKYFIFKKKNGEIVKVVSEIDKEEDFIKIISSKVNEKSE